MTRKSSEYPIGSDVIARDVWTTVPLDWNHPDGETIEVYARELVAAEKRHDDLPLLVFLQGGPGGKSPRPLGRDSWLADALARFRVVLPDQRGTGRSTPLSGSDFTELSADDAADRLAHYRADSIIQDLEAVRAEHYGGRQWWTLGQSYGGFLTLHYLSVAPQALIASAVTGGLPSIDPDPDEVYRRTLPRVREKNRLFRERFPHLTERIARVADILSEQDVRLPDGDRLTVRRLQTLGFDFGMAVGADRVHWIFDEAFADAAETRLSDTFLESVAAETSFATNPLFIVLQESIYGGGPSNWAAHREVAQHDDFAESARPLQFTGEMVFPWMFEEIRALRGFQAGVSKLVASDRRIDLYDTARLAQNEVPVEAAVYFDDMYVDAGLSLDTAARVRGMNAWVTNEFEHDGLRVGNVVSRLFERLEARIGGTRSTRD